jgi:hypothetical protein
MAMTPESVYNAIDQLVGFILRYAVTLAAISALSMALIEALKALLSWRDRFHKQGVRRWVQSVSVPGQAFDALKLVPPATNAAFHESVYMRLIRLTTGETVGAQAMAAPIDWKPWVISPANALFALELGKMMGQIQDAADTALVHAPVYPDLYLFLSAGAEFQDIVNWYDWTQRPPVSTAANPALAKDQADTYTRLRQFIRRRLDAFQLTTDYRWQTENQVASVLLGAVLLFGSLVYLARATLPQSLSGWIGLLFASLIGGIMAPVAKDLVIALKRARSGG